MFMNDQQNCTVQCTKIYSSFQTDLNTHTHTDIHGCMGVCGGSAHKRRERGGENVLHCDVFLSTLRPPPPPPPKPLRQVAFCFIKRCAADGASRKSSEPERFRKANWRGTEVRWANEVIKLLSRCSFMRWQQNSNVSPHRMATFRDIMAVLAPLYGPRLRLANLWLLLPSPSYPMRTCSLCSHY